MFTSNVERIRAGQLAFDLGQRSYDQRINCFGDLSFEEFATQYLGLGTLPGDSGVVDDSIVPETERIVQNVHRSYVQPGVELDWSLTGEVFL